MRSSLSNMAAEMGKVGGRSKSKAKLKAIAINAKKGGRPKGSKNKTLAR
jgi:hypothetical protein